jgi:hypothetical protein
MPVGIVAMPPAQSLVDQQGEFHFKRDGSGCFERRILVRPQGVVCPVNNELTLCRCSWPGQHHRPFRKWFWKMIVHEFTYLNRFKEWVLFKFLHV